jgi:hypothetical protein
MMKSGRLSTVKSRMIGQAAKLRVMIVLP